MILGIMQPYFFPYLGYFDLINYSERWIVFDTVQYIRHGWINRNRILHPAEGWSYIIVPVKFSRETAINEVHIAEDGKWKKRIIGQLQHYKKQAPHYRAVINLLEACFAFNGTLLSEFNTLSLQKICTYLGIPFNYSVFSSMNLDLDPVEEPGDWALRISQSLGASEYINPPGGEQLFDKEKFSNKQIKLTIRNLPTLRYDCPGYQFEPNLSILDVLMWNEPEKVRCYLGEHLHKAKT